MQFFALCEILEITDINKTFQIGNKENLFSRLNKEGQDKAIEYINRIHLKRARSEFSSLMVKLT